ncbi:MAG TPA: LemA family protein, partial [Armatimonadota bacterium]|nr:LemA family protein [Armatimonadota bacterium]
QVEVELRARYDVVDNLVSVVKAAAEHERSVLEAVTRARGSAESAAGIAAQISAQGELAGHIRSLIALGERYPSLRTHTNFLKLQQQLSAIETKIAYARGFYNESVTEYNTTVGKFPLLIVAKLTGHAPCPHYVTEEHLARGVAEPPHVAIDR